VVEYLNSPVLVPREFFMKKVPLNKGFFSLVDDKDYEFVAQWTWHFDGKYAFRSKRYGPRKEGKSYKIYLHRLITNCPPNKQIDHINRNALDNRKCNLRICTKKENNHNRDKNSNNTSGFKGVWWDKRYKKWSVQIQHKHIGRFETATEGAIAYDKKAKELYKEFAMTNF